MKSAQSQAILLCLAVFSILIVVNTQTNSTRDELDRLEAERAAYIQAKETRFQELDAPWAQLRESNQRVIEANIAAVNSYSNYFNKRQECHGYDLHLDLWKNETETLNDTQCWEAPVNWQSRSAYIEKLQLEYKEDYLIYASKFVREQQRFNADVLEEFEHHIMFGQTAMIPLRRSLLNYRACLQRNSTGEGSEDCEQYRMEIQKRDEVYNRYRSRAMGFGQSIKGPVIALQNLQAEYNAILFSTADFRNQHLPKLDQLRDLEENCFVQLASLEM